MGHQLVTSAAGRAALDEWRALHAAERLRVLLTGLAETLTVDAFCGVQDCAGDTIAPGTAPPTGWSKPATKYRILASSTGGHWDNKRGCKDRD